MASENLVDTREQLLDALALDDAALGLAAHTQVVFVFDDERYRFAHRVVVIHNIIPENRKLSK